jgi:hypothetical protein
MLVRMKLEEMRTEADRAEWRRLVIGVRNNQPDLVREWMSMTRNQHRHALREAFGPAGDQMRSEGWGSIHFGPLTEALIKRFMVRLSKALYYRHNAKIFDGVIYSRHISLLQRDNTPEYIENILSGAPAVSDPRRGNKQLIDQFIYRFNHNAEHGCCTRSSSSATSLFSNSSCSVGKWRGFWTRLPPKTVWISPMWLDTSAKPSIHQKLYRLAIDDGSAKT